MEFRMTYVFTSTTKNPFERGVEFGRLHAEQIKTNVSLYQNMFQTRGAKADFAVEAGQQALDAIKAFAPDIFTEIIGLAEGAALDPALIGMLNARTEILALLQAKTKGECSVVIHVPHDQNPPTAVQTWDWFYALRNSWLVWEIPLADGSMTKTMTEYGIVGKSGLNTRGLGHLFTILHHVDDGKRMGVPVHVAARWALDNARNIAHAAQVLASADVSASSSINLVSHESGVSAAMTVELHPGGPGFVLPNEKGVLVHTNHFLGSGLQALDTEPKAYPDTLLRYNLLQRRMAALTEINTKAVLNIMASHSGGEAAVCCHHNPDAPASDQYETLSTVMLDLARGNLNVKSGGPCTFENR
jgi:isopenicillin-N N-acyltransferase like protein